MQIEQRHINSVQPYIRNARVIKDKAIDKVAKSLAEFGWKQPLVVDADGVVIVGHTRLAAAKRLGWTEVPVLVATDLTPAQVKAYRLMDNRSHEETDWDMELLSAEIIDLDMAAIDLQLTGFTLPQIEKSLTYRNIDGAADEVPEAPDTPVTRPGDVWVMGSHRLLCGDATSAADVANVLAGATPGLMVTDPPYGVEYRPEWRDEAAKHCKSMGNRKNTALGKVANDGRMDWSAAFQLFAGAVAYIWHADRFASEVQRSIEAVGFDIRAQIIWAKNHIAISRGHYHWQHEPCWYSVRRGATASWHGDRKQTTLWQVDKPQASETGHGTQKPVELMRRPILNHTKRGDAVYDPFLGSGTTLIAAEELKRTCYGLEIDPKYCDVIVNRWQAFTGKQAGLVADGRTFEQVAYDRTEAIAA